MESPAGKEGGTGYIERKESGGAGTRTIDKVARILLFVAENGPVSANEAARRLEMPKTTVHRMLKRMDDRGVLSHADEGLVIAGLLSRAADRLLVPEGDRLRRIVTPYLVDLYMAMRMPVGMAVARGDRVVFDEVIRSRSQQLLARSAERMLPHAEGAAGLLLTAYLAEAQSAKADPARLVQFAEIRRESMAVSMDEKNFSCAVPVYGKGPLPLAAISITGPRSPGRPEKARQGVQHVSALISADLRSRGVG
ncbi:MarR family transcriptional regulator [Streptomyces sp. DT171]|uniref:MarR family transcriptional regulator n=1 Tax=Streptomyces sp. DT171 TaxID=3416524 RepID=UPI003CED18C6